MFKHNLTPVLNTQRKDKDGRLPLRIRATIKGKVSYYPTGIMLIKDQWDKKNKKVIDHPSRNIYNSTIATKLLELEQKLTEADISGETYKLASSKPKDFYAYIESKIIGATGKFAKGTIRHKSAYLNKIKTFKQNCLFKEITPTLLTAYESYCRKEGNKENTVWSSLKFIKTYIHQAQSEGLLSKDCLNGYKNVAYENPQRNYLTAAEILKIEKVANDKKVAGNFKQAANWFLFSCYSGLRFGDTVAFDVANIENNQIKIRTEKTGSDVIIPVHDKLKKVIERINSTLTTNQDVNRNLKAVAGMAGITKHLTFHIARHTFAVQHLERGGRMEVLSKLLGHTDMKITQLYGKISNKNIEKEMKAVWGK